MSRRHIRVLLAYLILALALTWPLAAHFATHVPGDGIDDPSLAWNLWWVKHALVDQPQNPFISAWQFWPIGINLAFYTLTVLNGMLGVPLQAAAGLIPTYNLLLISSFVLGGFGAYLLALDFAGRGRTTDDERRSSIFGLSSMVYGPFLAGALYAFASAKLFYAALGQGNIASSQWAPFAALYIVRAARPAGRWRDAALAALFIVLQAYAELTYASFLLIFVALAAAWRLGEIILRRRRAEPAGRPAFRDLRENAGRVVGPSYEPISGEDGDAGCGATAGENAPSRSVIGGPVADAGRVTDPPGAMLRAVSRLVLRMALLAALFLLGVAPILGNMLPDLRAEGDFFTSGGGFADIFSADLAGYLVPTQLHPLLGGIVKAWSQDAAAQSGAQFAVNKGQQIYVGYAALALVLLGLWHGRRQGAPWFWAASALLFFLLTLGPSLRVAGHDTGIPLPFRIMEQLPFFKGNRYPSRYGVMLLLSLAPLVAAGARGFGDAVMRRMGVGARPALSSGIPAERSAFRASRLLVPLSPCLLVAVVLFEHLSVPLPIFDLRVPALYQRIAAEPGDFAVLELPPGWRNGARVAGKQDIVIMQELWNQTAHGQRVLGGNTSRNPEFKFQYFSEDPTLARLIALTNAADLPEQHAALREALAAMPVSADDRARAQAWAAFLNLRYVMVHRDKVPPETEAALRDLLPVELVGEEGSLALYRLAAHAPRPHSFALGTDGGRMALAEGWSSPAAGQTSDAAGNLPLVYAQRSEVRLLLPLETEAGQLRLHGEAFAAGQQVTAVVDGRVIGSQALPESLAWLTFDIPAAPTRPPLSDVRLRFSRLAPLTEVTRRQDQAGPAALLVRSAGQETGDFGHIYVDGVERSFNQRGYNLVALYPDGRLLAAVSFDTHGDPAASARLARWIAALPAGTQVAGAVRDEASMNLGQEAVDALRSLGVADDLRGHFRWGHAFIGRTGSAPGTAEEATDGVRPAQVSRGLPLNAASVAAAFGEVEVR